MKRHNHFFDELGKIASTAFASASNTKREICAYIKEHIEIMIKKMNFITRDEFEPVRNMSVQMKRDIQEIQGMLNIQPKVVKKQSKPKDVVTKQDEIARKSTKKPKISKGNSVA
ncbi:accessory factor UbiK family protein [Rickettsiales endosymbiont of Peranema trichophorum]|uniref:accessory factor UbiK family protein n=1 Tax=Rickettsiales endosymbiont of Peranema trichophorum TaxID=2486577 RepID=UPI0010230EEF|nr:accessory factor UbiK family protein [Rickettsiales endosymbiont of Peranema trichophorum]RZI47614.1 accessory factor UbiK family protein [Rickettsiales endosymbiont of Peranema trichophorum]